MAWSRRFLAALSSGRLAPRLQMEAINLGGGIGGSGDLAEELIAGAQIQGQILTPQSWGSSLGGFSVDLVADDPGPILRLLRRGSVVALKMGFSGWGRGEYETVALGRVRAISGVRPNWRVEALDAFSALTSRPDSTTERIRLFSGVGTNDTLGADYAVGDGSLSVSDLSLYEKDSAGNGLVRVTGDSGATFYLLWSSKSGSSGAGTLTLASSGADHYGTTRETATAGNLVEPMGLLRGHPWTWVRKLLTSTGNANNGAYDTLPRNWGLALPDAYLDHADLAAHQSLISIAGTYEWSVIVEAPLENGWSWLRSLLQQAGFFLTVHQGQITLRGAHTLWSAPRTKDVHLTPREIRTGIEHQQYDPQVPVEYAGIRVYGPTLSQSTDADDVATAPAERFHDLTLEDVAWHDEALVLSELRQRLLPWSFVVPERATLPLIGGHYAGLAPGDVIKVSHPQIVGRWPEAQRWVQRPVMVIAVHPDFYGPGPTIEVSAPPPYEADS